MLLETIGMLNEQMKATILMVTHDAFTASYAKRIPLHQGWADFQRNSAGGGYAQRNFFGRIIDVVTLLGGDANVVM